MTDQDSGTEQDPRIIVTREGGVARLTLSNPRRKNAITLEMGAAIEAFCDHVAADETIGAVLVTGAAGYFSSGADTRLLAASSAHPASPQAVASVSALYRSFTRVGSLPVPTVSLVEGGAVGAGMNLALATDLLLVTPEAVLDSGFRPGASTRAAVTSRCLAAGSATSRPPRWRCSAGPCLARRPSVVASPTRPSPRRNCSPPRWSWWLRPPRTRSSRGRSSRA